MKAERQARGGVGGGVGDYWDSTNPRRKESIRSEELWGQLHFLQQVAHTGARPKRVSLRP